MSPEIHPYDKSRGLETSLLIAAKMGRTYKVRQLLEEENLSVDVRDTSGKTPLILALEGLHEQTIAVLLDYHPNIHARCPTDESAFQLALKLGLSNIRIVQIFLLALAKECRNNVHALASKLLNVDCPLYLAVLLRKSEVLRAMLRSGCPVDDKDPHTLETALHLAVAVGDSSSVKLFVECGADIDAMDSDGTVPLAGYQSRSDSEEELEMLRLLIDRCTTLTTLNNHGLMPVRSILIYGKKKVLEVMVRSKIDWCATDIFSTSPLHYLACNEALVANQEILDDLQDKMMYDPAREQSSTRILPFVALRSVSKLVEMLLDRGVDPNTRDSKGCTALLYSVARFEGKTEEQRRTFMVLLQRGADPQIVSNDNQTVFDVIVKSKNNYLAEAAIRQLLIDESLGTPIVDEVWSTISSEEVFQEQLRLCKREMEVLKRITIHHSVTMFDVLTASEKTMTVYARNDNFSNGMKGFKLYSSNLYFNYVITQTFLKTVKIVRLRKHTAEIVSECTRVCYDAYPAIIDKITDYIICKYGK